MGKAKFLGNAHRIFDLHRKLLTDIGDMGRPIQGQEDGQFKIGKKMVLTSGLTSGQAVGAPQRGHIPGVDERLVVRFLALATTLLEPSVDLGLGQTLECSRHEKACTGCVDDLNIADVGLG